MPDIAADVIKKFKMNYEIRVSNLIYKYLKMTVEYIGDEVKLHNQPMVELILKAFGTDHFKPVATPLLAGLELCSDDSTKLTDSTPYHQLFEGLMHLTNTVRLKIAFFVHYLARFMPSPTDTFWEAGKHILRYLKGAMNLGIRYSKGGDGIIGAFANADCG